MLLLANLSSKTKLSHSIPDCTLLEHVRVLILASLTAWIKLRVTDDNQCPSACAS